MNVPSTVSVSVLGAAVAAVLLKAGYSRAQLSLAKHRSLAGHARWSRRFAKLVPYYEYSESEFFRADDAPDAVAQQRRAGFARLTTLYAERFAKSAALTSEIQGGVSDMQ